MTTSRSVTSLRATRKLRFACALLLISALSIWLVSECIGHSYSSISKPPSSNASCESMPSLTGNEAIDHLKQQGTYSSLSQAMSAARYQPEWQIAPRIQGIGPAYELKNAANNLLAYVNENGLSVTALGDSSPKWQLDLKLTGYGYGSNLFPVVSAQPMVKGNRVELSRDSLSSHSSLTEWFVNTNRGIEHGFDIAARPGKAREGEALRLRLGVTGDLTSAPSGSSASFRHRTSDTLLSYSKLFAVDARGRALEARMKLVGTDLFIEVEDIGAEYPVTIDPLMTQQQKLTASDGASFDQFGDAIAISGDTVVVGASTDTGSFPQQGSAYVFVRSGANWTQQQKLTASDPAASDEFGFSVAIDGDTIVIGAVHKVVGINQDQGSAYVFVRNGATWSQQKQLIISDGLTFDQFGVSVAISGDTIVVGAQADDVSFTDQGSAYVFVRSGTNWTQQAQLTAADAAASDVFGCSVAINNNTIVVGAHFADVGSNNNQGCAYVFMRSGSIWTQQAKLTASDGAAADEFGNSVAIGGDTVVVGALRDDAGAGSMQGSAYIFVRSGLTWTQQQKLIAGDGAANDQFGLSVSISGDIVAVGSPFNQVSGQGSAYLFVRSGVTWTQQQKLTASDGAALDHFGFSIAISGDTVVAGSNGSNSSQGAAYVFVCTWSQQTHLFASDGAANDFFGLVAISGDTLVVGAGGDDVGANVDQGSAYVFVRSGSSWSQQQQLTASDGAPGDAFGISVAISGDTIVIGASVDDIGANTNQGSAYVFVRSGTTWTQQAKLIASDGAANDDFGNSVAISGDTVVVASEFDDVGANTNQGSAYVFTRSGTTWSEQQKITAADGAANDSFGANQVAISGDTIVVGAIADTVGANAFQGSAYVFTRSGTIWTQQQQLTASDGVAGDEFGSAVSISGDTIAVGAQGVHVGANTNQGSAYVFVRNGTNWTQQQKLTSTDGAANDVFGSTLVISGDTIVVGAIRHDVGGNSDQGTAYVFMRSGTTWTQRQELTSSDGAATDHFGLVALSGNTLVIGANSDDVGANTNQGSAYIFTLGCNTSPIIVSNGGITQQKGSTASQSTIATVFDSEDPIGYLTVSVASAPSGISVTNITNTNGIITAIITATCAAPLGNNIVALRVADSDGGIGSVQLIINVTPNNPPTLGVYPNTTVSILGATTVTPNLVPSDNGSIVSFSATSPTYTGVASVSLDAGTVSISNARPGGTHLFTVTAVDNCGVTTTSGFTLTVTCQSITVNPASIPSAISGSSYSQTFTQTGGSGSATFSLTGTLPTGLSFAAATATVSGTPSQIGSFPFTVAATDVNGCSGSRNYNLIVGASQLVWNGAVSGDWHNAGNWTPNAVPGPLNDVLIPSTGVINQPSISSSSSSINALTIQTGRVLTINSGLLLSTSSDLSTSGQITGPGSLLFDGSTFTQNGSVSLSAVQFDSGTHTLSGGGSFASGIVTVLNGANVTLASNHSLSVLIINSGGFFDASGQTLTLTGAGTAIFNSGSFNGASSSIIYQGSVGQVVTPNINYNNLTINNPAGVSLAGDTNVYGQLNLLTDLSSGSFTLNMPASGSSAGTGDVIGNVRRSGFALGSALSFGNPFNTLRFNSGTPPTDVAVNLAKTTPTGFSANCVARTYTITPNGGAGYSATLRLHYQDTELNSLSEASLELWRFNGSTWQSPAGAATRDASANWVEESGVSAFSPWAISGPTGPTLVDLISFTATVYDKGALLEWQTGFEADNLGFNLYRGDSANRQLVNPHLVAGSALTAGSSLLAGQRYAWWDELAGKSVSNVSYWLEDIDLKGQSTWHGPFFPKHIGGEPPARSNAAPLSNLASQSNRPTVVRAVERNAAVASSSPLLQTVQAKLISAGAAKLSIQREGFYRLTQSDLASIGFNTNIDPRHLQLFADGRELPIFVDGSEDGRFDLNDSIQFYAVGIDSPFTNSRVYWLVAGNEFGLRMHQIKSPGPKPLSQSFTQTVERRDHLIYFAALRNGDSENFFGPVVSSTAVDQALTLEHLASTSADATLEVTLQGVTLVPHHVRIELNGAYAGDLLFDAQSQASSSFAVPHSLLVAGDNHILLTSIGGPSDISLLASIRIAYQHSFVADDNQLRLRVPSQQTVTIDGFNDKSIRVIDVTDSNSSEELLGEIEQTHSGYSVTFASTHAGQREFLCTSFEQQPARLWLDRPSNLCDGNADFVIITTREFADSFKPLATLRQSQGLRVAMLDIEDLYDEFSFGQKSPFAIKDFLAFASTNWKIKPRFVLFAADASVDPKNYLGLGDNDLVPTRLIDTAYLETASDDWFVDFDDDGLPDIAVGRLPVRTSEEADAVVSKIVLYQSSIPSREALLIADAPDGYDFERATNELTSFLPSNLRATELDRGRETAESAKKILLDALARGPKLVNYDGHGSANTWDGNLLTSEDALSLTNRDHLSFFVMMTCLNGYFQDAGADGLAEALLKSPGGAVAVWASSGTTLPDEQTSLNQALYRLLFNQSPSLSIGEAVLRAKASVHDSDIRRTWILFGDPTMKIR